VNVKLSAEEIATLEEPYIPHAVVGFVEAFAVRVASKAISCEGKSTWAFVRWRRSVGSYGLWLQRLEIPVQLSKSVPLLRP